MGAEEQQYLRIDEFGRWAESIDKTLDKIDRRTIEHGEMLAVMADRIRQEDDQKTREALSLRRTKRASWGALASGAALAAFEGLRHLWGK